MKLFAENKQISIDVDKSLIDLLHSFSPVEPHGYIPFAGSRTGQIEYKTEQDGSITFWAFEASTKAVRNCVFLGFSKTNDVVGVRLRLDHAVNLGMPLNYYKIVDGELVYEKTLPLSSIASKV